MAAVSVKRSIAAWVELYYRLMMPLVSHPASRASFCLLDWGGEKEADVLESRHTSEVAAAKI